MNRRADGLIVNDQFQVAGRIQFSNRESGGFFGSACGQAFTQPLQAPIIMMAHIGERLTGALGNIPERQSFKESHFNCLTLGLIQHGQSFIDQVRGLLGGGET